MEMPSTLPITKFAYPFVFKWKLWKRILPLQDSIKQYAIPQSIPQYPNILYYPSLSNVQDNIKIFFHIDKPDNNNISATFTINIPSARQSHTITAKYGIEKIGKGEIFCTKNEFFDPEKKYFVEEFLNIIVEGVLIVDIPVTATPLTELYQNGNFLKQLWKRNDKDFTIVITGDTTKSSEIKVHKLVLATKSSVFNSMINTDMKEKAESKVKIIDFDAKTVQTAIEFLYDCGMP